ncbi:hypothetical protein KC19_2G175200 [Ceratodon purpureus]|uniref:Uncharacterized protein n=1 Tax=Ceratodon purpureus TaxID=3225 RepID=A0A8T0IXW6_CERPU|nr:hypothetical protein KC19_2G175200 [Ceratodon purpureus]
MCAETLGNGGNVGTIHPVCFGYGGGRFRHNSFVMRYVKARRMPARWLKLASNDTFQAYVSISELMLGARGRSHSDAPGRDGVGDPFPAFSESRTNQRKLIVSGGHRITLKAHGKKSSSGESVKRGVLVQSLSPCEVLAHDGLMRA